MTCGKKFDINELKDQQSNYTGFQQLMIGIVIVTHNQLADALIDTAVSVIGRKLKQVAAVCVWENESTNMLHTKIAGGIDAVYSSEGVLILTDMFGGVPSDLSYSFLKKGKIEVISSINLPILLKAVDSRKNMNLSTLSRCLEAYGKKSISVASEILGGNARSAMYSCPLDSLLHTCPGKV